MLLVGVDIFMRRKWEDRLVGAGAILEKVLLQAVILGLVGLVVVQGLLTGDPVRRTLNLAEKFEYQALQGDQSWETTAPGRQTATVILRLEGFPSLRQARVMLNGRRAGDFSQREVTLKVRAGDELAIDGSYYRMPLKIKLIVPGQNVVAPRPDTVITTNHNLVKLGQVKLK